MREFARGRVGLAAGGLGDQREGGAGLGRGAVCGLSLGGEALRVRDFGLGEFGRALGAVAFLVCGFDRRGEAGDLLGERGVGGCGCGGAGGLELLVVALGRGLGGEGLGAGGLGDGLRRRDGSAQCGDGVEGIAQRAGRQVVGDHAALGDLLHEPDDARADVGHGGLDLVGGRRRGRRVAALARGVGEQGAKSSVLGSLLHDLRDEVAHDGVGGHGQPGERRRERHPQGGPLGQHGPGVGVRGGGGGGSSDGGGGGLGFAHGGILAR